MTKILIIFRELFKMFQLPYQLVLMDIISTSPLWMAVSGRHLLTTSYRELSVTACVYVSVKLSAHAQVCHKILYSCILSAARCLDYRYAYMYWVDLAIALGMLYCNSNWYDI